MKALKQKRKTCRNRSVYKMPITEFLERNASEFPNDICLVEINPEIKENRRVTWKEYELIEPTPQTSF
jgi:hypothetical protein